MRRLFALLALALATLHAAAASEKPNIALILADDMGIECLFAYGGTSHKTPNIDRLAKEGMRFTRCFSNPLCSPSPASGNPAH